MGLLQHFSNSILHWQESIYQSNAEDSKIQPFWKSQAPTFKMHQQHASLQRTAPFFYAFIRKVLVSLKPKLSQCDIWAPTSEWFSSKLLPFNIKQPISSILKVTNNVSPLPTQCNLESTRSLDASTSLLQLFSYNVICTKFCDLDQYYKHFT